MIDLGTLGGSTSWGLAINNSGTVVGFGTTRTNVYHAFVSTDGGKMKDLNKLIPARSGWVLAEADGSTTPARSSATARSGASPTPSFLPRRNKPPGFADELAFFPRTQGSTLAGVLNPTHDLVVIDDSARSQCFVVVQVRHTCHRHCLADNGSEDVAAAAAAIHSDVVVGSIN